MNKVWLITGASSGFGRAIAEAAVAAGDVVVGAARRPEGLDDLVAAHPDQVEALRLDVSDVTAAEPAVRDVIARHGRIDVLVNNAGRTHVGAFEETTDAGSRSWTHDGLRPIAQLDLADTEVDAQFYAIVTDLVGTPTELVTTGGDLAWHSRRTLWGAPAEPAETPTPLRFPGQYADEETGWYYNVNRYYDPATGRYASQDPLGLLPAPNPGAYVSNPTRLADPLGLAPCTPGADDAPKALPSGHKVDASWGGTTNYKHGGEMTAIEHINYRHAADSGFSKVSHYADGTSVSDVRRLVDDALRHGDVSPNGTNGHSIVYDAGRVIGTDAHGNPASHLQVYVRDGRIQTAFPIGP